MSRIKKTERIGRAVLLGLFVVVSSTSSLFLLNFVTLTEPAQAITGYVTGGFATVVFGYVVWKSVQ